MIMSDLLHSGQCSLYWVHTHMRMCAGQNPTVGQVKTPLCCCNLLVVELLTVLFLRHLPPLASRTPELLLLLLLLLLPITPSHPRLKRWCSPGFCHSPVLLLRLSTQWWAHPPETPVLSYGNTWLSNTSPAQTPSLDVRTSHTMTD